MSKIFGIGIIGCGVISKWHADAIEKIDDTNKQVEIKFDDEKIALYDFQDLEQIEHSYSITIHKAQRERVRCSNHGNTTSCTNAYDKKFIIYWNY